MRKSNKLKVSVVLCTYNRAWRLPRCLEALQGQSLNPDEYELIVVNDGSVDDTAKVLRQYNVNVVTNAQNQGLAQSRNNGVLVSRANIIAFTDDDCVPDRDWLENLIKPYSDSKIMGVGGKIVPYQTNTWLLRYYRINNPLAHVAFVFNGGSGIIYSLYQYVKRSFTLRQLPDKEIDLHMIVGANMSMRRSVFNLVGGFDKAFRFGGEEDDFWVRLQQIDRNTVLRYTPKAVIKHDYEAKFRDALRRNFSYGKGAARTYLKHNDRVPVLFPFPFIVILALLISVILPYFLIIAFLLSLMLYFGWLKLAINKRRPQYILFAYVQMILELVNSVGFIRWYLIFTRGSRQGKVS